MNRTWNRLRFLGAAVAILLATFILFRAGFFLLFEPPGLSVDPSSLAYAFYLGFKYDLRLTLLLLLPFLILGQFRPFDPTRTARARRFWLNHLTLMGVILAGLYLFDLGNYAYLTDRIDASAVLYLKNPIISLAMVWESYPVVWCAAGVLVACIAFRWILGRMVGSMNADQATSPQSAWHRRFLIASVTLLYIAGIYGKFSHYPLRWSDAFFTTEKFVSDLALNPLLFFANSLGTSEDEQPFDVGALTARYPLVAGYLGVDDFDPKSQHFARYVRPLPRGPKPPNVVVVFLESFATHRTGSSGNPLDASPHFDAIAADSLLFRQFYTPRTGTARGVFATLTGIPDTITFRTASRNPSTITQNTVLRAFENYRKFYFLGGSANWANIRALFVHNHSDFEVFEEGDFESARADVWGIPDYYLFEEANTALSALDDEPFFAFIHLAGNHRPYTIPDDIPGFSLRDEAESSLQESGFESLAEFNSFRLLDFSLGHFFEVARRERYFENTIFMILSDNGAGGHNSTKPACEEALRLGVHHSPLAIYAPALFPEGRLIDTPATQMDVMPTAAALAGIPALNTTLGRNLFDPRFAENGVSFAYRTRGTTGEIVLYDGLAATVVDSDGSNVRYHACPGDVPLADLASSRPEETRNSSELAQGLYHASKFLLYNNSPRLYEAMGMEPIQPEATEGTTPSPNTSIASPTPGPHG